MNPDDTRPESEISDSSSEQSLPHELWLGEMLGKRKELEGSYVALARAITESVPPDERFFSREKRKRSEVGDYAGDRILFLRRGIRSGRLMLMSAEGGEPEELLADAGLVESAAWLPGDERILYVSTTGSVGNIQQRFGVPGSIKKSANKILLFSTPCGYE